MSRRLHTFALLCSLCIASVGANMMNTEMPLLRGKPNTLTRKSMVPQPQSIDNGLSDMADLRRKRNIAIFTTASLPWLTGTSINPLLRAIFLEKAPERHEVTLCIPFISPDQQRALHPKNVFETPKQQEAHVRNWVQEKLGYQTNIDIKFYDAKFVDSIGSIIATGDMTECVPEHKRDVAVLEEPEHLNWFHTGNKWCDVFNFVVGVVHTKYLFYRSRDAHISPALRSAWTYGWEVLNAWVARAYCHHLIKLSDAVQDFSNAVTCNVHGVRDSYRNIGLDFAKRSGDSRFKKGAYYIGKVLWSKGYRELVDRMKAFRDATGINLPVDCYGSGPDLEEIQAEVARLGLNFRFLGAIDHADPSLHEYKILINPSLSDVVCTTSAEALAMGKFLLCPVHPSNEFFTEFPNTLTYDDSNTTDFVENLKQLIDRDPTRMTDEVSYKLSWECATERFYDASAIAREEQPAYDKWLANMHGMAAAGLKVGQVETVAQVFRPAAASVQIIGKTFGIEAQLAAGPEESEKQNAATLRKNLKETQASVKSLEDIGRKIIVGAGVLGGLSAAASSALHSQSPTTTTTSGDLASPPAPKPLRQSLRVPAVATQLPPQAQSPQEISSGIARTLNQARELFASKMAPASSA